jgi:HSP20 family protein
MLLTQMGRTGWDPFADLRQLQAQMNRLFEAPGIATARGYPPVNLWLGDNSVVVTAELPGLSADDVELTVRQDTLVIRGQRPEDADAEGADWHRRERPRGAFSRVIGLPFRVDPDRIQARFQNGVLEVEMQRPEADRPRRIAINGN